MLIIMPNEELNKFPVNQYDENENLTSKAPYNFHLLSQNMNTYFLCGTIDGDVNKFLQSDIAYEEVTEIPVGYEQRVLPPQYGIFLTIEQITTGLMLENKALIKQRADIDFIAIMAAIDLEV